MKIFIWVKNLRIPAISGPNSVIVIAESIEQAADLVRREESKESRSSFVYSKPMAETPPTECIEVGANEKPRVIALLRG